MYTEKDKLAIAAGEKLTKNTEEYIRNSAIALLADHGAMTAFAYIKTIKADLETLDGMMSNIFEFDTSHKNCDTCDHKQDCDDLKQSLGVKPD